MALYATYVSGLTSPISSRRQAHADSPIRRTVSLLAPAKSDDEAAADGYTKNLA